MLPFLKHTKEASVSAPPDKIERKPDNEEESSYDPLEDCLEEMWHFCSQKDFKSAAEAFRAAFEFVDSQPHQEGSEDGEY